MKKILAICVAFLFFATVCQAADTAKRFDVVEGDQQIEAPTPTGNACACCKVIENCDVDDDVDCGSACDKPDCNGGKYTNYDSDWGRLAKAYVPGRNILFNSNRLRPVFARPFNR